MIEILEDIWGQLVWYFTGMFQYAGALFEEGYGEYGLLCIVLQLLFYLAFSFFFKVAVFDILYPKIRIVDHLKNTITYARKVKRTIGNDDRYVYWRIKFKLRPILRWHTIKLPKPSKMRRGIPFVNRRAEKVPNGFDDVEWRRMPSTVDIITSDINIYWNEKEKVYELTGKNIDRTPDIPLPYRKLALKTIQRLAHNVHESVMGDHLLVKDHMQTGITLKRHRELLSKNIEDEPLDAIEQQLEGKYQRQYKQLPEAVLDTLKGKYKEYKQEKKKDSIEKEMEM